jgi:hypothetical protein
MVPNVQVVVISIQVLKHHDGAQRVVFGPGAFDQGATRSYWLIAEDEVASPEGFTSVGPAKFMQRTLKPAAIDPVDGAVHLRDEDFKPVAVTIDFSVHVVTRRVAHREAPIWGANRL